MANALNRGCVGISLLDHHKEKKYFHCFSYFDTRIRVT